MKSWYQKCRTEIIGDEDANYEHYIGMEGTVLYAGFYLNHVSAENFLKNLVLALIPSKITVEVHGGVAYCDDSKVEIINHDNH